MPLLLTEADVRRVLPMDDLITTMESALARFSAGEIVQPLRNVLDVGSSGAFFGVMPAYVPDPPALGTKLVSVFGRNLERGLPSHLATVVLLDPQTGALVALMDGRYITEARTAAVSAVATKYLGGGDGISTLCLLGSGVQARSHLEAMACVRTLREVRVWSPTEAHRDRFVREMSVHSVAPLREVGSAEEAVRGADLIVLATAATDPVLMSPWVSEGAHVVAVGACRPDQREMDPGLVARARLFVDSREAALAESGDVVMALAEGRFGSDHIVGELGELIAGRVRGRTGWGDVTIFKSLGMAVEDVVAAALAYERALEAGLGTRVDL